MLVRDTRRWRTVTISDCPGNAEIRRGAQAPEEDERGREDKEGRGCIVENGIEGLRGRFSWQRTAEGDQWRGEKACQHRHPDSH